MPYSWCRDDKYQPERGTKKPQEPAALQSTEDELAPNPFPTLIKGEAYEVSNPSYLAYKKGTEAQLAHDKARMAKLPSEDELEGLLEKSITKASYKLSMYHLRPEQLKAITRELHRLLREKRKYAPAVSEYRDGKEFSHASTAGNYEIHQGAWQDCPICKPKRIRVRCPKCRQVRWCDTDPETTVCNDCLERERI